MSNTPKRTGLPAGMTGASDDGEGRETNTPSEFQLLGTLVQKVTENAGRMRFKNDNQPGWDAAENALPVKKEGS